jgi:glycosyltransferase involved in cell wall biosynthesis
MNDHLFVKIALIPAYQPDNKLIMLVDELMEKNFHIVVVDDGSGKDYNSVFRNITSKATLISYEQNKGKGYALKTGIKYIRDNYEKCGYIVTLDSDGQHKTEDAERMCKKSFDNKDCLIIGSRAFDGKVPFKSKFGNDLTRHIFSLKSGIKIYDTQTGLRAFSCKLARYLLETQGDRYEFEMNMLLKCAEMKIPIIEEWIETIYLDGNKGSHFNPLKDSYRIYKAIFNFKKNKRRRLRCQKRNISIQ